MTFAVLPIKSNIHTAILREERGSWGVDIPPGLPDDAGLLYEIGDNANLEILRQQVVTFRRWMAEHGWRDKPLIVTEFSVLMPPDYGFPFEVVRQFMVDAFDFLLKARDPSTGQPAATGWSSVGRGTAWPIRSISPATCSIQPAARSRRWAGPLPTM